MRPASMTETTRLTRRRAISGCQVTSTKWQPKEWVENLGLGRAEGALRFAGAGDDADLAQSKQVGERNALGRAVRLHKHLPFANPSSVGLAIFEGRAGRGGGDSEQRLDRGVGGFEDGGNDRFGDHRAAGKRAGGERVSPSTTSTFVERDAKLLGGELGEDRVGAGADVLRGAGDAGGAIVAQLDARGFGRNAGGDPGAAGHAPAERQAVALHGADFGVALGPAELFGAELEAFDKMARGEGHVERLVDLRLVDDAESASDRS